MAKSRKDTGGEAPKKKRKRDARGNGHGTLERKPNGVYRARWIANGKRFSQSTGTKDKREAQKILEKLTAPFRLGDEQRTLEVMTTRIEGVKSEMRQWEESQPSLAIADMFAAYRKSTLRPDSGERTLRDYATQCRNFAEWLQSAHPEVREMREVTQAMAEEFASDLRGKRSAGTFNKHIVFFRCLWRTLMNSDEGKRLDAENAEDRPARLTSNPWEKIKKRENTPHTRRELTVEELGRVVSSVEGEMKLLFAIGIYTGLRLGDCALLDWGAIDIVRGRISVTPRKTARHSHGKVVTIPIHPTLAGLLLETPQDERQGCVLPELAALYNKEPSLLTNRIQKVFRSCGIQTSKEQGEGRKAHVDVGFHSLRHTFVSLSANAGAPLALVQAIVGHSNPAMTRHYFHESESALKSTVAALPDVISVSSCDAATQNSPKDVTTVPADFNENTRIENFKAIFAAMTDDERKEALLWAHGYAAEP